MFERSHVIKLTMVLYRVSDFFPEKEPLKALIRKKADEVLAGLILLEENNNLVGQVLSDVEIIKAFIELAENQNWLKKENFEVLKKEYCLIGDKIKEQAACAETSACQGKEKATLAVQNPPKAGKAGFIEVREIDLGRKRCFQIINILKKGKPMQVKDLKDVFPDVSKRTLRRDFEYLLEKGLVERMGDNNNTEYKLKSR